MSVTRVNDFKHFPSDVLGGALLGSLVAAFGYCSLGTSRLYRVYGGSGEDSGDSDVGSSSSIGTKANSCNSGMYFYAGEESGRGSRCRETTSGEFSASLTRAGPSQAKYNTFGNGNKSAARLMVP